MKNKKVSKLTDLSGLYKENNGFYYEVTYQIAIRAVFSVLREIDSKLLKDNPVYEANIFLDYLEEITQ